MVKKEGNEKLVVILSYFLVGIIWYFADEKLKKDAMVKFHVKQALNLFIINIGLSIIISMFLFNILGLIGSLVNLLMFVLWILGLINGINMKKAEVPIVGQFAEKYLKF